MRHTQLPDLRQAKFALERLAATDLSEDNLEIVIPTLDKFVGTLQSALNHLTLLRKQRNA